MTTHPSMPLSKQQIPTHLGWGLSGLTPYYLYGQTAPVSGIINGSGASPGEMAFGVPIYDPAYLSQIESKDCTISAFPDLAIFGSSIQTQIAKYGEFTLSQATVWADDLTCTIEEYREALQQWIAENQGVRYPPEPGRICLFITKLDKGGAERQIVLLARGLTALGYQVTLICQSPDDASTQGWQQQLSDAKVERLWLDDARQTWQTNPPDSQEILWLRPLCRILRPRGAHNVLSLSRIYARIRPQYVISYLDDCNIVSAAAAIVAGVSSVAMSVRSTEPNLLHPQGEPNFYVCRLAQMKLWYQAIFDFDVPFKLYANSSAGKISYEHWLSRTLTTTVENAVEATPSITDIDIRVIHQLPAASPILLGVMRFTAEKNPDGFIRVVARLVAKKPHLKAILLGDGPMRAELENLVLLLNLKDSILLPGKIDDPTVYLQQATCLLCPSHAEGMPNIILEAQAQGLPLVCNDVGGTLEALHKTLHLFSVTNANEQSMVELLIDIFDSHDKNSIIFENVRKEIIESRHYNQLAAKTIDLFNS